MGRSYLNCLLLVALILLAKTTVESWRSYEAIEADSTQRIEAMPPPNSDPETLLALGLKIPLFSADIFALEQIPGISDRLAQELWRRRSDVVDLAQTFPPHGRAKALLAVPGVGAKTAAKLDEYLDLETSTRRDPAREYALPLRMMPLMPRVAGRQYPSCFGKCHGRRSN